MMKLYLLHGSGAGHQSVFLTQIKSRLEADLGGEIEPITLDYMQEIERTGKKRPPPKLAKLVAEVGARIDPQTPIVLLGKSMGSRIIAELCQSHNVQACVALGFPFYPAKKMDKHRLEHLEHSSEVPFLILQGTRDALGSKEWVQQQSLPNNVEIQWLDGADHDFNVLKRYNLSDSQVMQWLSGQIKPFLQRLDLI
ncbi:Alpha/beta hydrolase family protein [Marinomonas aquimarina]|uniref:Alpha/beta hydrolase family protein n=1 Tax=Marinomonas aquimarina TaxID=295068 RepID=A0A1A8TH89_9GAMM|nr:alpha/beta family hydrolase [Marinomonas aquimarina]SBS32011.1 Alpha/beta hydrolase family protein [Marinomonas aquimarina]